MTSLHAISFTIPHQSVILSCTTAHATYLLIILGATQSIFWNGTNLIQIEQRSFVRLHRMAQPSLITAPRCCQLRKL